jgi:hypothetical protein
MQCGVFTIKTRTAFNLQISPRFKFVIFQLFSYQPHAKTVGLDDHLSICTEGDPIFDGLGLMSWRQ